MQEITNNELKLQDIPVPSSGWSEIGNFALTFNGYEACGSFEQCADIASSKTTRLSN